MDFSSIQDISALLPGSVPPLTANETLRCSLSSGCTREVFLQELVKSRVAYQPNTTPGYTNVAFSVLGLVVEAASGSTFHEVLDDLLVTPLNLSSTTISAPDDLTNPIELGQRSQLLA